MNLALIKQFLRVSAIGLVVAIGSISGSYAQEDTTSATTEVVTLDWIDLIPESERNAALLPNKAPLNHDSDTPPQNMAGGFRDDLDGKQVRIPGFVIPLEGDDKVVTELLLVPYFGACIHVPPPPPNQILYVKFDKGVPIQGLWDVVYIVGTLNVEMVESDLGQAGYLINGVSVETYDDSSS
ncbi:DUF3299 domain-containing protein [Vibrio sp. Y2-5]|nr:DUF3299 domain-containing protein [Vibrio sp. Y2-5]MBD0786669.1 DUF3299 domain-containing protein [Vibrio sp. Y2-5]